MIKKYTKKEAQKALNFWKRKLNEAIKDSSCNEDDDMISAEEFFKEDDELLGEVDDLPTMEQTLEDEELIKESSFEPNTVGALIQLLKKSDPNDKLMIRLIPEKIQCMIIGINRNIRYKDGITCIDIAKGTPS